MRHYSCRPGISFAPTLTRLFRLFLSINGVVSCQLEVRVLQYIRNGDALNMRCRHFYRRILTILTQARVPFLVGGAYGLACYTGVDRSTKDLDIFGRPQDRARILKVLSGAGFET